jgi:hypothetical protein
VDKNHPPTSCGVFKPVGHLAISFPPDIDLGRVVEELGPLRVDITRYSADEMRQQVERDLAQASVQVSTSNEMNLVREHLALAREGYGWLVVKAETAPRAKCIASVAKRLGAERAELYGRLMIEQLIDRRL